MRRSTRLREGAAILLAALLIAVLFATGILDRQKVWTGMTYGGVLTFRNDTFPGGQRPTYSLENGDSYGVLNGGPGYTLPRGRYQLKYQILADGENVIRFRTSNGVSVEPARITTDPGEWEGSAWIELEENATDFEILFEFASGTYICVEDATLFSPAYRDDTFTASLLIALCCLLCILYGRGKLTNQDLGGLVLMGLAMVFASAPAFKENMILAHDTTFHMARLMSLADGLEQLQIPVRLGGFTHNGYGVVTSVFYPDLLLYPFALMIVCGASITYVMNLICVAVNAVAGLTMYACAKRIFASRETGVCASVMYVLSTYRVANMYSRCAMGEMWGMALLPLFTLSMWEVVFGDKEKWPMLAVSAALIYLSHIITTLICAAAAVVVCALCAGKILRERRLLSLVKAALFALLMGMYTLAPFLMYSAQGLGAQNIKGVCTQHMLSPAQLLLWGEGDMPVDPRDPQLSGQALEIGVPMLIGAAALLYLRAVRPEKDRSEKHALFFLAAGMAGALMATTLFPWALVTRLTKGLSNYLQFPWRMLLVTALMLSLAGGYAYMRLADEKKELMLFAVLALSVVMVLPTITEEARSYDYLSFGEGATPRIVFGEYTIPGTDIYDTLDRGIHTEGDVTVTDYARENSEITAHVDAKTDAEIALPLFGYDGYRAAVDGKDMDWTLGDNNRLTVHVPAGTSGALRVWFAGKAVWRAADCVSLAAALGLAAYVIRRRRRKGEKLPNQQK